MKIKARKISFTFFVLLVVAVAPKIGTYVADQLIPHLTFIDPHKVFMWGIIHHIVQALIPFSIILLWRNRPLSDWGFQVGHKRRGLQWVGWFTVVWFMIYLVITVVNIYGKNIPQVYYDVTDSRNLMGELFFRGVIVGLSEEILFRSFPIVVLLMAGWDAKSKIFSFDIAEAGIIAAVLFALAHIGLGFFPLELEHFSIIQTITALGFGLLYAIVFRHTRSIYYPMLIHGISDLVPVFSLYAIHILPT